MWENLCNILVASKMNFFKCNNMLELSGGSGAQKSSRVSLQQQTSFRLFKVTKEIIDIVELESRGKSIQFKVSFENSELKNSRFLGHSFSYQ